MLVGLQEVWLRRRRITTNVTSDVHLVPFEVFVFYLGAVSFDAHELHRGRRRLQAEVVQVDRRPAQMDGRSANFWVRRERDWFTSQRKGEGERVGARVRKFVDVQHSSTKFYRQPEVRACAVDA